MFTENGITNGWHKNLFCDQIYGLNKRAQYRTTSVQLNSFFLSISFHTHDMVARLKSHAWEGEICVCVNIEMQKKLLPICASLKSNFPEIVLRMRFDTSRMVFPDYRYCYVTLLRFFLYLYLFHQESDNTYALPSNDNSHHGRRQLHVPLRFGPRLFHWYQHEVV